ncbi:hypothetical protein [Nonlabens antarcticus]|uniref:hypothetical protein n=1 Tax=Nonlabens antarcticus TaxID=392714 RepID=UPI00189124DE|nr:hypothetical protein [Nonlabens antarcticus]
MNIEKIKTDLAVRVQKLMAIRKETGHLNFKAASTVKTWRDKVTDTEELVQKVYDTLNEVLQCNGIQFSNHLEYDGLISDLEPTVNDLVLRNMED